MTVCGVCFVIRFFNRHTRLNKYRPRLLFTCSLHVRHYTGQRIRADKVLLAVDVIWPITAYFITRTTIDELMNDCSPTPQCNLFAHYVVHTYLVDIQVLCHQIVACVMSQLV